jgi:hypothetical protein
MADMDDAGVVLEGFAAAISKSLCSTMPSPQRPRHWTYEVLRIGCDVLAHVFDAAGVALALGQRRRLPLRSNIRWLLRHTSLGRASRQVVDTMGNARLNPWSDGLSSTLRW